MATIDQNLTHVLERIHRATLSAKRTEPPQLLAVSKMQTAAAIRTAYEAGQRAFGESYLQEAIDKQAELANCAIEWHFIGPIQANKTRGIAEHFSWAHSVSRIKIAQRLNEQRPPSLPPLNICLQVNLDEEESKAGISLTELSALAEALQSLPQLHLRGLMAIPAPRKTLQAQQDSFQRLTNALLTLQKQLPQAPLDTLSMGMSTDLEAAIAAGATIVRVGTAVFGQRNR
jgi:PLP dependent protein